MRQTHTESTHGVSMHVAGFGRRRGAWRTPTAGRLVEVVLDPHYCACACGLCSSTAHCDLKSGVRDAGSGTGDGIAGCRHPPPPLEAGVGVVIAGCRHPPLGTSAGVVAVSSAPLLTP